MKKILIGDEFFDKTIFDQQWFYEEHPLLKKYQTIEIEDEYYIDCVIDDFDLIDNVYIFNVEKYNARKQKETNLLILPKKLKRLEELRKDIVQDIAGLYIEDIETRKEEYRTLLNEVRILQEKPPREIKEI